MLSLEKIDPAILGYLLTLINFAAAGRLIVSEVISGEESPDTIGRHSG
jgi:hypothetical protein